MHVRAWVLLLDLYRSLFRLSLKDDLRKDKKKKKMCQPFLKIKILASSKLKKFTDDSLKFGENGRKFSKQVENIVGKGEIARHEQFLLFS